MQRKEISEIINKMTLNEKAELCSGGNFWNTKAIERLNIPFLVLSDGPSGLRKQDASGKMGLHESNQSISFPSGSLVASSWDRNLMKELGETLGEECIEEEVDILLGPSMNIKRSPLCGRNFEYYSEDPLVSSEMAGAYIDGLQSKGIGACPKHFYANNMEERRMSTSSELDERTAREIYLASFEGMVKEHKPKTIMCSYNKINGTYAAENKEALTDILRDEWGFDGIVVSDWGATNNRVTDLRAGLDIEMPSSHGVGPKEIVEAVENGRLSIDVLDDTCERILRTVFEFSKNNAKKKSEYNWQQDHDVARKIATESMVLLKNEGVLPLSQNQSIVFIGPYAQNPRYQGGGSSHVHPWKVESIWDQVKDNKHVHYVTGFVENDEKTDDVLMDEAVQEAAKNDVAIIFAGLPEDWESEGFDRSHLKLPRNQTELIENVAKVQKNTVVVLHNGAPIEMPWIDQVAGVLESYLGGEAVGAAQYDLLFGNENPSGHLAETFPLRLQDTPTYLNFRPQLGKVSYNEGVFVGYRYYETVERPVLFPFGHGLSYTTFEYSNLHMNKNDITSDESLIVSVDITNIGKMKGKEVVQLYVSSPTCDVNRPVKELRGFEKIELAIGETKTVTFVLEDRAFSYWDEELHDWYAPNGMYRIQIGRSVHDIRIQREVKLKNIEKKAKITKDTAIGDLSESQIARVMQPFAKRNKNGTGDHTVSSKASQSLQLNMPLRSLVSFGAMSTNEFNKLLIDLEKM